MTHCFLNFSVGKNGYFLKYKVLLILYFPNGVDFIPQQTFGCDRRRALFGQSGVGRGAPGTQRAEPRDAAEHPVGHKTTHHANELSSSKFQWCYENPVLAESRLFKFSILICNTVSINIIHTNTLLRSSMT